MRMLKPSVLFVLILCTIQPNNGEGIIEKTCNRAPHYFLECVKYVKSYPNYPNPAKPVDVVIIMVYIMRDKAMTTSTKSRNLLPKARPGTREYQGLQLCATSYNEIATSNFRRIRESLLRGDPKVSLDIANDVLGKVRRCEMFFHGRAGGGIRTPLTDENNEMDLVVTIAANILDSFV
ncbi:uncharacterized protein LOC131659443 [Vicia villosa]|uniref:uncharacterized protein LOC131659443 n=1 Tax=Vicia villosa TaxID=3911 RepID=UPI00273B0F16|nr:uncharacterized protein LOC131659443 [Vicia villosa]